jgi:CBS domain-containing protein
MSRPVFQLTSWTAIADAAAFLLRHDISGAPVIDEHGKWIGVFTQNDLSRAVQGRLLPPEVRRTLETREPVVDVFAIPPEELRRTPVRAFMTLGLYTVFPDATEEEVVHTMTKFHIHRVFVIDEEKGNLLGVITTMDVLRGRKQARRGNKKTQQA